MPDTYQWVAFYQDGTVVQESQVETFREIDRERCVAVELWPTKRGLRSVRVEVDIFGEQRAVFFRRRRATIVLSEQASRLVGTLTIVGWESPTGGAYLALDDEGSIQMACRV